MAEAESCGAQPNALKCVQKQGNPGCVWQEIKTEEGTNTSCVDKYDTLKSDFCEAEVAQDADSCIRRSLTYASNWALPPGSGFQGVNQIFSHSCFWHPDYNKGKGECHADNIKIP